MSLNVYASRSDGAAQHKLGEVQAAGARVAGGVVIYCDMNCDDSGSGCRGGWHPTRDSEAVLVELEAHRLPLQNLGRLHAAHTPVRR